MSHYYDQDDVSRLGDDDRCGDHEISEYGPADEMASAWFDEGVQIDPAAPMHPDDAARLADLAFLNALLERIHVREGGSNEDRVERVIASIGADEDASIAQPIATPASVSRSWLSSVPSWAFSSLSAAAVLLVLVAWYWNTPTRAAHAAVQRAYLDAAQLQDRQYRVSTEMRISTNHTMSIESQLTVRGSEKFTLRHPMMLGQCWIGSNGKQGWFVPAVGVPRTENDPVIAMEWARKQGVSLPDMHVSALIDYLATRFDLELLPSEKLPGEGDVLWQRVRGVRREPQKDRCQLVELWAHPRTGVARKIVLEWDRQPGELGLACITLDLVGEKQLPDSWYEAANHQPLPILPLPPIVPVLRP